MARREPLLLAIDQGSGGTRVLVFNTRSRVLAEATRALKSQTPRSGWVEHAPSDLLAGTRAALSSALRATGRRPYAVGLTTQRSTVLLWDRRSGRPLTPAVSWQDRRAAEVCRLLEAHAPTIVRLTGLPLSPHYAAPKIRWLLDHLPEGQRRAEHGDIVCGTINTFLLWHLSGGISHLTDHTQAGRMLLMNLQTGDWDDRLCDLFGVPRVMLPEIRPTLGEFGAIFSGATELPVFASIGDQQAAALGQGMAAGGDLCLNYGTGAFALLYTGQRLVRRKGLLSNIAWSVGGRRVYVLEGGVNAVGSGLRWLSAMLGLPDTLAAVDRLAFQARHFSPVLPAFAGLAAPYWDARAEGIVSGLTLSSSRADVVGGFLEGVAFLVSRIVAAAGLSGSRGRVVASGGLSVLGSLLQAQAEYLGRPVSRCRMRETSAWGAASLAGVGAGVWKKIEDAARSSLIDRVFEPTWSEGVLRQRIASWGGVVTAARDLAAYTEVNHSE